MYTPRFNTPKALSVSQINFYIKSLLENDTRLNMIMVSGEISNLSSYQRSGHIYLSLKDEKSVLKAVMFAGNARRLTFNPTDGMKVICRGRISLYEPSGQYQLYIEDMQPDGAGALALAFEQLKTKLSKEGLFDESHKKPIPEFPRTIGVVTSPTGAAVQDIKNVLTRRFPLADIVLCPVLVQGEGSAVQLVKAVQTLDKHKLCDVIIIGRGGGSAEDLWSFNDESLAYAIYNCSIPVISGVGHETDFTICDFVSDLRAPTPSAAAELAVPDRAELLRAYRVQAQYLCSLVERKARECTNILDRKRSTLNYYSPANTIQRYTDKYRDYARRIKSLSDRDYKARKSRLSELLAKLDTLNPMNVLKRGYTITEKNSVIITSSSDISEGDEITVKFSDGKINAKVTGE